LQDDSFESLIITPTASPACAAYTR
jgi:hypothetical protein